MAAKHKQRRGQDDRRVRAAVAAAGFEPLESRVLYSVALAAAAGVHRPIGHHPMVAARHVLHAAPALGGTGVSAEYFSDSGLTVPQLTRTDPSISFAGAKGFAASLKSAGSAQWTGSIAAPTSGTYTFSVQSNGAVTLSVNGTQLINTSGGSARSNTPFAMVAGQKYAFQMTYAKAAGAVPSLKLFWGSAKAKQQVVPQTSLFPAAVAPTLGAVTSGLIGQYFVGDNFQQLAMTRVDPSINFNFGTATPDASIPAHSPFTVQWTGQFTPAKTDNYTFSATADDGVRIYIDGQLVVNDYTVHAAETATGSIVLNAGQAYAVKVQYFNSTKQGTIKLGYSTPTVAKQPLAAAVLSSTPPATAGVLTVADTEATEVDLAWTGSVAATGYTVEQSTDGGTTFQPIGTAPAGATTFADTGLTADTAYAFRVTPFGSTDTSTPSNVASATTLVPAPGSVTATAASATEVDLSWADVPGETGFTVLASSDGGTTYLPVGSTGPGVTSFAATPLLPGASYQFEVEALNAAGQPSDPSTPAAATTPAAGPAGVVAVGTSTSAATVTWLDTVGDGGFVVERSTDGTTWAPAGTTAADVTTFADAGLAAGTTYGYRVRSVAAADPTVVSGPSAVATATTVTAAPTGVTATPYSDVQVNLSWADVTGEAGFTVLESVDGGATFAPVGTTAAGTTTFAATPLLPAAAYEFEIVATNAAGMPSAASAPASATTPTIAPAALVVAGTATTSTVLTWTPVPAATGYQVERSADAGATWATVATPSGTTLTYTDATLSGGTSYTYRVRATDAGGASDPSPVAVTLTLPAAPAAVVAGVDAATSQVTWPAVTGAASYVVQRSTTGTGGWTTVATPTSTSMSTPTATPTATPAASVVGGLLTKLAALFANPAASTMYYYRVIASNATGSSAPSPVVGQLTAPLAKYAAATQIYGDTATGGLYSVDPAGTATTLIGQIAPGSGNINRSPVDGKIYSDQLGVAHPHAYTWDPATGNTADLGVVNVPSAITRGTFRADGVTFFTTADGSLYQSGTDTSVAPTKVGTLTVAGTGGTVPTTGDMAFSPTGTLYLSGGSTVYTVNTTTAVATPLGTLAIGETALTFGTGGMLYATTPAGSQYTLNLNSLAPTVVNNGGVPTFADLTALPKFDKFTIGATPATTTFSKGHTGAYQVQVTNAGPNADSGPVTVTATLNAGLTYAGIAGTGWTATAATNATTGMQTVTMTYAAQAAVGTALPTASLTVNVAANAPSATTSTFLVVGTNFQMAGALNTIVAPVAAV